MVRAIRKTPPVPIGITNACPVLHDSFAHRANARARVAHWRVGTIHVQGCTRNVHLCYIRNLRRRRAPVLARVGWLAPNRLRDSSPPLILWRWTQITKRDRWLKFGSVSRRGSRP